MPTNLKKRVRERMAKTGETWATALRHVRAQVEPEPAAASTPSAAPDVATPQTVRSMQGEPRVRTAPRLIFASAAGQQAIDLGSMNSLGRHPKSSIQLLDKIVAKEHCVLERRDGTFVLRDLGSLNGTYVNGERVRGERVIAHGDEIALGATRARYDDGSGPLSFALPAISPGVAPPQDVGLWRPPGGGGDGGGRGGAPAEVSAGVIHPLAPPPSRPN